ncbi:MAG TPA: archease [Candidatus Eisenbacteria bacterium]|jgi:SHS2 domain-containing protein|nr:archease [Candidatus Eisenbacteria bacterium]
MADKKLSNHSAAAHEPVPTERERTPYGQIEFRRHPSHVLVELRGHSAKDLFRLAAWALARVQVEQWADQATVDEQVELESDGWDDLVVNWLNQLLALSEKHRASWIDMEFPRLEETSLRATVKGRAWPDRPDVPSRDVKAAAYTGLEVIPGPSLWLARVTIEF